MSLKVFVDIFVGSLNKLIYYTSSLKKVTLGDLLVHCTGE